MGKDVGEQRLIALFLCGCVLLNYPLLALWNRDGTLMGVALFPATLFLVWAILIAALAWIVERRDDGSPLQGPGPSPGTDRGRPSSD